MDMENPSDSLDARLHEEYKVLMARLQVNLKKLTVDDILNVAHGLADITSDDMIIAIGMNPALALILRDCTIVTLVSYLVANPKLSEG
jgi:hypothetical protein